MKSLIPKLASLSVLSVPLALSAQSIEDRLDTLESDMQQISTITPMDTLGTTYTSAQPSVQGSNNWFVTFDITYWHTKMGGTEYAYSVSEVNTLSSGLVPVTPPINGDTKDNDFGWDIGIKAGLGYKIPQHDQWDIYARYTWYDTEDSDQTRKSSPSALYSLTWPIQLVASHAKSHININTNNIDLELGRSYFVSQNLAFRPHFGLKSTWIDINQKSVFTFSGVGLPDNEDLIGLDFKAKDKNNFWGIGPRIGFDSKWFLGYGFHIFGDAAAALLYGKFSTASRDFGPSGINPDNFPDGKFDSIKHKFHRYIPYTQMFLGLGWDTHVNDEKQHIGIKLGYEVQYYWRINQSKVPDDITFSNLLQTPLSVRLELEKQSEDLMFYGITGEVRLDF